MILAVEFNFTRADKRDPQSEDDCEVVEIRLGEFKVERKVDRDVQLNHHLLAALYRIHQLSETK